MNRVKSFAGHANDCGFIEYGAVALGTGAELDGMELKDTELDTRLEELPPEELCDEL